MSQREKQVGQVFQKESSKPWHMKIMVDVLFTVGAVGMYMLLQVPTS